MDINTDLACSMTMDPCMVPRRSMGPDVIMALTGIMGHFCPSGNVVLNHKHILQCQPYPWAFIETWMVTVATDINTDAGCSKAMDPDMALGHSLGPNISMVPCGSTFHPDLYGLHGHMTLKHQHGLRYQLSMTTGATDINIEPCCCRATDLDIALRGSLGSDVMMKWAGSAALFE